MKNTTITFKKNNNKKGNHYNYNLKETDIVKECIKYLTMRGYVIIRNNSGALKIKSTNGKDRLVRFGDIGSSDIIGCSPDGRFIAVECKKKGNKLTIYQENFLKRVKKNNGITIVAYSIDDLIKNDI